jgi:UDP-GlcNAc3NAcA epimerase
VLVTAHRPENVDQSRHLEALVDAVEAVSRRIAVVWPLHPRTRNVLRHTNRLQRLPAAVRLIEPVSYLEMMQLERHAAVIATDSGGVQKEAFFYRVPCVTLRHETEWVELIEAGWNRLAPPTSGDAVANAVLSAIHTQGKDVHPYGTGDAAARIVARLQAELGT